MDKLKFDEIISKLKKIYDSSSLYINPEVKILNTELSAEIKKKPSLISDFINELLQSDLSEERVTNLYLFLKFLAYNKQIKEFISEKDFNFYLAIQSVFGPFLHFQIPITLWFSLAEDSWMHLKEYNSGKFSNIDDFTKNIQPHIEKCSNLLESFREHPIYGAKIKAKDWGYV